MTEKRYRRSGRKKKKHILRLLVCFLVLAVPAVTAVILVKERFGDQFKLVGMSLNDHKIRQVMDKSELYPDELLKLLADNDETADFVLDYPKKKDEPPADTVGNIKKGEIPLLLQWDERWGYSMYGDEMIALNGCGPTAVSMVASGLTGNNTITPYKVAKFSEQNGYYAGDTGTSWGLMTEGVIKFGIQGEELPLSEQNVFDALNAGHPVICSMKPGDFTQTGHFVVLTGVKDGKIKVNDPNSKSRSEKLWDYDDLEKQINDLWVYSLLQN